MRLSDLIESQLNSRRERKIESMRISSVDLNLNNSPLTSFGLKHVLKPNQSLEFKDSSLLRLNESYLPLISEANHPQTTTTKPS